MSDKESERVVYFCFLNPGKSCGDWCMAFTGRPDKQVCVFVESAAMMGAVSAHALKQTMTPRTKYPESAPPPKVNS